jgi:amino acid adenylation domain-containing protein
MLRAFLDEPSAAGCPSLRRVFCSGEVLPPDLQEQVFAVLPGVELHNLYGPTEASVDVTFWACRREAERGSVPIGRPIANTAIHVLDRRQNPVPIGVAGELHIGGSGLARGYLARPELTTERFVPDPFGLSGARLYATGDLARFAPDGAVEFLGRLDHQVKVRGFRIELGEIETALLEHPGISAAVVMARPDESGSVRLAAYVVPGEEAASAGELRRFLDSKLPGFMVPAAFVFLAALPLTASGKLDRRGLPSPELSGGEREGEGSAPAGAVEELLAAIWEDVLRIERVGRYANFFDLGGHSLLATQVVSRIRQVLSVELPLRSLFQEPTVAGLARAVEEASRSARELAAPPLRPAARDGAPPLSFAQERLWFLDQLQPGSALYNMPASLFLPAGLQPGMLAGALAEVVRRHETLRTMFREAAGQPVQVIAPAAGWSLPQVDLSTLPLPARDGEAAWLAAEEARRPFDLSRGPLLRTTLLCLGGEAVLLLNMHHIVSDGWSMGVLEREVMALYEAFSRGEPSPLPELPIQYADFAVWQRAWLSGGELERQLGFWRAHLAGAPAVLDLPADRPRPAVPSYRGAQRSLGLSAELSAGLKALGRREGATLFMVLLGSFAALLSRLTAQDDVVVGSPIANRNRVEIEGLIGFFVNTLVLRTDVSGEPSFRDLLGQIRQVTLEAYAHQDLPFERLVDELRVERSLSHAPLFQVMLMLQNAPGMKPAGPGPSAEIERSAEGLAKFDLTLSIGESGSGLRLGLQYSRDLFDGVTIERLLDQYARLLGAVVASPESRILDLPVLGEAGRQQVLVEWNDTVHGSRGELLCLHQLFEHQAERTPEAVAAACGEESWSYGELNRRANRLAHALRRSGVGTEVRVGVLMDRSLELVAGLLGILKAGGAYVPLDPAYPADRLAFMAADAGIHILLTQERLREAVAVEGLRVLAIDADQGSIAAEPGESRPGLASPGDAAYVIYTSGSTGRPKGVCIEHRSAVELLRWAAEVFSADDLAGVLASTSISFDLSVFELFLPLSRGGAVLLAENALVLPFLPAAGEVTLINTVPSAMSELAAGMLPPKVRTVNLAGETLGAELVERIYAHPQVERVVNLYGPSEDTTYSTFTVVERGSRRVSIGRPVAGSQAYVVGRHGEAVPGGAAGELCLAGAGLARGYLGRPDLTAERFVPDPFGPEPGARMYRTGDRCRSLQDGRLELLGRLDHQVKLRGFRIELGEIETALVEQVGVREAAVLVREDLPGGRGLAAHVAPAGLDIAGLRSSLRSRLPEHMVPSAFFFVEALPRTPNGKIDRRALALRPLPERAREDAFAASRTASEELIAGIWSAVLGVERVGIHDNFFDLGGHSLLATQVVSLMRQVLAVELPLRSLFQEPTVAGLARLAEEARRSARAMAAPPIHPVLRDGALPLSFAQERMWFLDQLKPGSPLYSMPMKLPLPGGLRPGVLEHVLAEVVRRHEALRTTFRPVDGQPEQVIAPAAGWSLPEVDLSALAGPERGREARRLASEEGRRPFDLARGPLLRTTLLRLGGEAVLLLNMHHIVSDGWSMGVLEREVTELYGAFSRGEPSPLPELPIQYADFAVWQRSWLSGGELERQLGFWRAHLAGAPAVLELPADHPRPAVPSYRGAQRSLRLSAELSAGLKALGRRQGATLFMVLLGSFAALLSRLTSQEDVVVGSPIANRNRTEIEGLIGLFVNTLVLRTDVADEPCFLELLGRVRQVTLEAYGHQDLPFERLVEDLQVERSLSHSPLFQVVLVLQNTPGTEPVSSGPSAEIERSVERSEEGLAKHDLTLSAVEAGAGLRLRLQYSRDLFDGVTMERLLGCYERLLRAAVSSPQSRVVDLPMLGEAERHQLLLEWSDTARPGLGGDACVHHLIAAQAGRTPDATAVVSEERTLTYRDLERQASLLAHHLRSLGVGPEVRVGLCVERSPEMVVGVLGILAAGGAYVPLDAGSPPERLATLLDDLREGDEEPVVVTRGSLAGRLPVGRGRRVLLDGELAAPAGAVEGPPAAGARPENAAYVLYTSGSTGKPKGVVVEHRQLLNYLRGLEERLDVPPGGSFAMVQPLTVDSCKTAFYPPLLTGGALHLISEERALDPRGLAAYFREHRVDGLKIAPSHLAALQSGAATAAVLPRELLVFGGEASRRDWALELRAAGVCRVFNHYGPTEATVGMLTCRVEPGLATGPSLTTPVGRPLAGSRAHVLDRRMEPVPPGVAGELYIGGLCVARGYLGRPDLTAERFVPDPWERGGRLYATGDLMRHLPDGRLEFLGRRDEQVKVRGFRIELGEIEAALALCPGVREGRVVLREDVAGSPRLVGYVVPEGEAPSAETLQRFLRERLPEPMVPPAFVALAELPRTAHGKVDRRALSTSAPRPGDVRDLWAPPRDTLELEIARIWEDLLGVQPVGVTDDFFDLGGHSLLAVRLFARIEARCGIKLPLSLLFKARTVEGLAAAVRQDRPAGAGSPLVAIQPAGERPPFFCVHPVGGGVLCYAPLAHHLGSEQPFYGLQAQGIDGGEPSGEEIGQMASRYLEALLAVQPAGSYRLGGWSMGGVVAYEMAQQLRARGEEVALLALIDTPVPSPQSLPAGELDRMAGFALDLGLPIERIELSREDLAGEDRDRLLSHLLERGREHHVLPPDLEEAHLRRLYAVYEANLRAVGLYRPRPYDGRIVLCKAAGPSARAADFAWERYAAAGVETRLVAGWHYSLVREPDVRSLAAELAAALAEARTGDRDESTLRELMEETHPQRRSE